MARLRPRAEEVRNAYSPRLFALFMRYLDHRLARQFHGIRLAKNSFADLSDDRPLIIFTNHPGWWDPMIFIFLTHRLWPQRIAYGPMDQLSLNHYKILKKFGFFGIDLAARSGAADFLQIAEGLCEDPKTVLWITAQGQFCDSRVRPIELRPGLAHLARRIPDALLVPLAIEYCFWDDRLPEVLLSCGRPIDPAAMSKNSVDQWTVECSRALTETSDQLAALAITRNPTNFTTLHTGHSGAGGIYDNWRRLRAMFGGPNFQPEHHLMSPAATSTPLLKSH